MASPLAERLGARLASSLISQSSQTTKPWICAQCRNKGRQSPRRSYTDSSLDTNRFADYVGDIGARDGKSVRSRRDAYIKDMVNSTTVNRIAELTSPENWPLIQWTYMAPFRDFLQARGHPEDRAPLVYSKSDPHNVLLALRSKNPVKLIGALAQAAEDPEYLRSIPKVTWTAILWTVSPHMLTQKLHRIHRASNRGHVRDAGYHFRAEVDGYLGELARIIDVRKQHGIAADIVDYQILLSHAARVGNEDAARKLWADMEKTGIRPDMICYNRMMEAIVWDEDSRLRQTRKAQGTFPKIEWKSTNIALFKAESSKEIVKLYNEMTSKKIHGDVETHCVVLTALARDGHFEEAIDILSRVWKFDVRAIMEGRDIPDLKITEPVGSPLFPTPRLLVTVADIYGVVNRLPAGFRVVDYIARQYNIPLKEHVWYQLLKWTFLQAGLKEKHRNVTEDGAQLQMKTVRNLLDTMQDEPYNAKMNMDLYDLSFRTYLQSPFAWTSDFQPDDVLKIMNAARTEYTDAMEDHQRLKMQRSDWLQTKPQWNPITQSSAYRLLHFEKSAEIKKQRYRQYLQRWTKLVLDLPRSRTTRLDHNLEPPSDTVTSWRVRGIPDFLERWGSFLPGRFDYYTDTGIVTLSFRTANEVLQNKLEKASQRRETLAMKLMRQRRKEIARSSKNRAALGLQLRNARALDFGAKHVHFRPAIPAEQY